MREIDVQEALSSLRTKGARYASLMGYLHNQPVESIEEIDGLIFARFKREEGGQWGIVAADTEEQVRKAKERLVQVKDFCAAEAWLFPLITEGQKVSSEEFCYTYYLPEEVVLPETEPLPSATLDMAEMINEYWAYDEIDYVREQIEHGFSAVKYVAGKAVAWAMTHDDDAMGFMFVLPEFRRAGYATEVSIDLIRKVRASGKIPFVHIVQTNNSSIQLAQSMGMQLLKEIVWFSLE